jgi:two-component system, OmpR family, alkaline phosphatase synthesis response regulator PhoP
MERELAVGAGPACVLLVEDDVTISDLLAYNLRRAGYRVIQEYNGRAGLDAALTQSVDLVLMDLMLPGLDGMSATREIVRAKPWLPVIIVSALTERDTLLQGFGTGVDDYVTKPFDLEVLLARIAASLRRASNGGQALVLEKTGGFVQVGELVIDSDTRSVRTRAGRAPLTPKEHGLLQLLLTQPGHLFAREEITEAVWHHRYIASSRTLDVHVQRLRDKLQEVQAEFTIHAVRGVGYRFAPHRDVEPEADTNPADGLIPR